MLLDSLKCPIKLERNSEDSLTIKVNQENGPGKEPN